MAILQLNISLTTFLVIDSILSVFCLSLLSEILIYNKNNAFLDQ